MKKLIFAFAITTVFALAVFAQTPTPPSRPATTTTASTAGAATGGLGAEGKLAYINTQAFSSGIGELKTKLDSLNAEFEPKKKEVQADEDYLTNLKNKINTQGATVSVQVRTQWVEEATEKEKMLARKKEDYNTMGSKRLQEVTQPIYDKVGKFLESYCQQRGIVMVLEGGAAQQSGILLFAAQATDITEDFIKEYNKVNPAPAAAAAPAPKKP